MKRKILLFAPGTIGDAVNAFPAMKHLCDDCHSRGDIIHLYNSYPESASGNHRELFRNLNWFDRMTFRPVPERIFMHPFQRFINAYSLWKEHYHVLYDFPCNKFDPIFMLKMFGAKKTFAKSEVHAGGKPRYIYLVRLLEQWGVPPPEGKIELPDLHFDQEEKEHALLWNSRLPVPQGKRPFAVCLGGKSYVQKWSFAKYASVLKTILSEYDLYPVFFGGTGEKEEISRMISACGSGCFASDVYGLSLREIILALKHCAFYLGNNTGIMHLAGASGIPCIAVCASRDCKAFWTPSGAESILLASGDPCPECPEKSCRFGYPARCIEKITETDVLTATRSILHS